MDENEEEFTTTLAVKIGLAVAVFLLTTGHVLQAFDSCKECLIMLNKGAMIGDSGIDTTVETALNIITAHAYQVRAAQWYENMGRLFHILNEYGKYQKYLEKALAIRKETGDKRGEALGDGKLGFLLLSLGKYH